MPSRRRRFTLASSWRLVLAVLCLLALASLFVGCTDEAATPSDPVKATTQLARSGGAGLERAESRFYAAHQRFSPSCGELQSYDAALGRLIANNTTAAALLCHIRVAAHGQRWRARMVIRLLALASPQLFVIRAGPEGVLERSCRAERSLGCKDGTWLQTRRTIESP